MRSGQPARPCRATEPPAHCDLDGYERGAGVIERPLAVCGISTVNLAEVIERADVPDWHSRAAVDELVSLGLAVLPFERDDATLVPAIRQSGKQLPGARGKTGRLSLGDCCCLAVAQRRGLAVITDDTAWPALDIGVDVHLFR